MYVCMYVCMLVCVYNAYSLRKVEKSGTIKVEQKVERNKNHRN